MKRIAPLVAALCLATGAFAQARPIGENGVIRIRIQHADPWAVKALLEGTQITQPELSAILGFAGIPDKDSELIQSIFGSKGRLVVNPTDNSLLFIPEKK
ncbi:MAG TPA: hypothetical protein VG820_00135 [Fimbriimonadaceae bacterium]|nr:hypothetical protein [Fimbriimonadaceae bacterium]